LKENAQFKWNFWGGGWENSNYSKILVGTGGEGGRSGDFFLARYLVCVPEYFLEYIFKKIFF